MPPKKKKGAKKEKEGGAEEGGTISDADKAKLCQAALKSLQLQLADRTVETREALADKKEMLTRVESMQGLLVEQQDGTLDITRDMTRQYKGMQEELLNRINQLEGTIQTLKDELEQSYLTLERTAREKDEVINAKDKEMGQMRARMEDMAQEFGDMLKETLDKMRERIEINSTGFDAEDGIPIRRRMEEFALTEAAAK